ncbi:hypothetical protein NDU88_000986 [Pleurodeles waltl]|uniref:Uncharacterized protein n=1 Tax=Pleurodeles waltl TaxID=8319 RepID=A0AAV7UU17_PLEWA|nr:hypothetical protein NDU88_000986 [Pleurodeles waltl]
MVLGFDEEIMHGVAGAAGRPVEHCGTPQQKQMARQKALKQTLSLEPDKPEVKHKGHMVSVAVEAKKLITTGEAFLHKGIYVMDMGVG